jgi:methyl-accepting chemotaxis protein
MSDSSKTYAIDKTETYAMVSVGHKEKEGEENSNYFVFSYAGMTDAAKLLSPNIKIEWHGPNAWDPIREAEAVRALMARNVAGIVVSAAGEEALTSVITEVIQAGIPVITFDADAPASERLTFVGTDNYKAGYLAGKMMAHWIRKRGDVAISTMKEGGHLHERVRGFQEALRKFAPKTKTHIMYTENVAVNEAGQMDYRKSWDNYNKMLLAHPGIRGLFATFAYQGYGAVSAIEELKLQGKVQILAFDLDEETANLMEEGRIRGTVGQDPYLMGYVSMILVYYARHVAKMPTKHDSAWRITALTDFLNTHHDLNKTIAEKITRILSLLKEHSGGPPVSIDTGVEILKKEELLQILARNFEDMRNSINAKVTALNDEIAERTAELESLQHLMIQVMNAAERLGDTSDGLTQISTQMAAGAEQTSRQVSIVSSNSQQISQGVHDVSVAAEEVAASIQEISRNINEVTRNITNAVDIAKAANTTITDLDTHSQEIGNIIKVITNIAQQTKFLALNATIEAARAGESGEGFKVVANEVKDLARETAASAEDITHKIETIQISTRSVTEAMTKVTKIINRVSELSTSIATAILQQCHAADEISRSIADAAQGSEEISHTITEVATTTQTSSEQATHVRDEAQELSSLAGQLRQLVETFKR